MKNKLPLNQIKKMRAVAKKFSLRAHSPYSKACVGAACLTSSGKIFGGCNIENSSYGGTTCAEQVAIFKAASEGQKKITAIYVYTAEGWPPCGICRQVISEFATSDCIVIIGDAKGEDKIKVFFKEILPMAFTPQHLK